MNTVRFGCSALAGTNKAGNIKPDAQGYYEMVIGGLNIFNSAGQYYTYEGAKQLFEQSSQFQRRIGRGSLRGEMGHPPKLPGMTMDDYINRIMEIREANVCVHFKEVYLDFDRVKTNQGKPAVAIMAKLTPSGPLASSLEKSLDNPNENVCFSIRAFTQDYYERGVACRDLKNIITFDYVNECGVHIANKYDNPSLEDLSEAFMTNEQIKRVCHGNLQSTIATESSVAIANELLTTMGMDLPLGVKAAFTKW